MAGASACARVIVPKLCSNASQPARAPGTVTSSTLSVGMVRWPRASTASRVMRRPARPLEFKPYSLWSFGDHTIANTSPPIPVIIGSVTFSTAAAVTAASMALPPCSSTARPAAVASGWLVAIMPCGAYTVERWAMVVGRSSWAAAAKQASAAASAIERAVMPGISLRAGLPPPLPRKVRRRPRRHDPETDQRLHRPGHDGVQDDRYRRGDEQRRRDRVAGHVKRPRCVGTAPAQHEHARRRERREHPAREHHEGEQLLERRGQGEQRGPSRADRDRQGRRAEPRVHLRERPEE